MKNIGRDILGAALSEKQSREFASETARAHVRDTESRGQVAIDALASRVLPAVVKSLLDEGFDLDHASSWLADAVDTYVTRYPKQSRIGVALLLLYKAQAEFQVDTGGQRVALALRIEALRQAQ